MPRVDGFLALAGREGLFTLLLASLLGVLTLGLSLFWVALRVTAVARAAPVTSAFRGLTLVPGLRLRNDEVTPEFALRLERAAALLVAGRTATLMLLGGITGENRCSEAVRGRDYLLARGVPAAAILLEDRSRHTLENLWWAREDIERSESRGQACTLVSSRSHLARCVALARGLGLDVTACAAEERLRLSLRTVISILRETVLLHWYYVAFHWSRLTGSTAGPHEFSKSFK